MRLPAWIVFQVICHVLRQQDVTSVSAIHHPLRHVDSSARDVGLRVQVADLVNWAAVNAHADAKLGMTFQRLRDLHGA